MRDQSSVGSGAAAEDVVEVVCWDALRYGGDNAEGESHVFSAEIVDMRRTSGSLLVKIGSDEDVEGGGDETLAAGFEVNTLGGSKSPAPTLMLYDGDEVVLRVVKQPNGHLIEAMKPGVSIVPTKLPGNRTGWMVTGG